jgi:hypothetical protein
MFYTYSQNNSGGSFIGPYFVIVEADSARQANSIAQDHGVYYDGVEFGDDCECCGDRWEPIEKDSEGTLSPMIFGNTDIQQTLNERWWTSDSSAIVVYHDGSVDYYEKKKEKENV